MKKSLFAAAAMLAGTLVTPAFADNAHGGLALNGRPSHWCGTPKHGNQHAVEAGKRSTQNARAIRTLYLNKNGGLFTGSSGATNSSTNTVDGNLMGTNGPFTIPPISGAFNWTKVSQCVRDHFAQFNIRVTETEPTSGDYVEAVVGGDGTEIGRGQGGGLLGIASADNFCRVTERGVCFTFSEAHLDIPRRDDELCATIAHEAGHLLALYHEALSTDLMSYVFIADSGTKAFVNQNSQCGTSPQDTAPCDCPVQQANSFKTLEQHIGLRPIETNPPTLALKAPGGGQVGSTFEVIATASDDTAIDNVSAFINGQQKALADTAVNGEYKMTIAGIPEGMHTLRVVASDTAGNEAMEERSITVVKLATGETCVANEACRGGICALTPDGNYCTESCQIANDTCPDGFACEDIGGQTVCVESADGGCCSASPNVGAAGMLSLLVGFALFRRRRRQ